MNGASASTDVARISTPPNRQRNTASGNSQRLPCWLGHIPRASSAIEPPTVAQHDQTTPEHRQTS